MTVRSLPLKRTFAPLEVGCRPSPASITPDLTSSSLYFVIAPRISVLGISPASDSGLPGTRTMKRIGASFWWIGWFYPHVEQGRPKSTPPGIFLVGKASRRERRRSHASPKAHDRRLGDAKSRSEDAAARRVRRRQARARVFGQTLSGSAWPVNVCAVGYGKDNDRVEHRLCGRRFSRGGPRRAEKHPWMNVPQTSSLAGRR